MKSLLIRGNAFHTPILGAFEYLEDYLFLVDDNGRITRCLAPSDADYDSVWTTAQQTCDCIRLSPTQFLLPGFIDTHVHAPQWAQAGKALHVDLPTWLNRYTFPLEAKYSDASFAHAIYADLIQTLLANGTTTAMYFGSVHLQPNQLLAELCATMGQRAFIGKVVMDEPEHCPAYYRDHHADAAVKETEDFLRFTAKLSAAQGVYGVITPRFIPTCTDEVLYALGDLAARYQAPIQSHCSEGDWEHAYVLQRTGKRDTEALFAYGLLTAKTVLAHCVFLDDNDADLFIQTGAAIAHSPISNVLFANAVAPIRRRLEQGVTVGLATDISGGYSPSMFDAMRQAILSSRTLEDGVNPNLPPSSRGCAHSRLDFTHALYMATVGGAKALSLPTGQFKEGLFFDALLIDTATPDSNLRRYNFDTPEDLLQKTVFLGQRTNIIKVWVQGRPVYQRNLGY